MVRGGIEARWTEGLGSQRQYLLTFEGDEGGIGVTVKFTLRHLARRLSN
jgi:hypothetical protein